MRRTFPEDPVLNAMVASTANLLFTGPYRLLETADLLYESRELLARRCLLPSVQSDQAPADFFSSMAPASKPR